MSIQEVVKAYAQLCSRAFSEWYSWHCLDGVIQIPLLHADGAFDLSCDIA